MAMKMHPALQDGPIYLDYNATTPVDPAVVEAMLPYLSTQFGNPSSTHRYGRAAHDAVDMARIQVAQLLGANPDEIIFTGGGSESDNLAIRGVALARRHLGNHIITQATEHPAVLKACDALKRLYGFRISYMPVDYQGLVDPAEIEEVIDKDTILISIMHANNETGTIQPIAELAEIAHRHGVLFHTDAAQTVGKIPTRVDELGVDLLTIAGHKLYAPKGIGALYVRRGVELEPLIYGGGQETGRRAGTENVAYMVALGSACFLAQEQLEESMPRIQRLRDLLEQRLKEYLGRNAVFNGHPTERLPNTLNMTFARVLGEEVLANAPEVAASTGSACHTGKTEPSPVLMHMRFYPNRALGAVRMSLGRWSTEEEVERAAKLLVKSVESLWEKN